MMNKRTLSFLLYFLLSPLWAQGLLIATIAHAPPFEYLDGHKELTGFDIDLMTALCQRMNRSCQFKIYEFAEVLPALKKGEVDLAIAALVITPERRLDFLFSLPYKLAKLNFVSLAQAKFSKVSQLEDKRIGLYHSSPDSAFIKARFQHAQLRYYRHVGDLFNALKKQEVDVIVVEPARAEYWLANVGGFKILGQAMAEGEGYGIAANLGQQGLIGQINKMLKQMEQDGSYLAIYRRYFAPSF